MDPRYAPVAVKVGKLHGKNVYRFPVRVQFNDSRQCATIAVLHATVMAHSAADAANYMRDQYATRPETEVYAIGPKGAETKRYIGWQSAMAAVLFGDRDAPTQLKLFASAQ